MNRLIHDAQDKSQWLLLALAFVILTATISLTILWPPESRASDHSVQPPLTSIFGSYSTPQHCAECHKDEFQAWANTSHAHARFDPVFQASLERAAEPGECFSCHTTGYNSATGQFVSSGVTCEACHGPYRSEHPEESMDVAASEDLCGTCHTSTLSEWTMSRHGKAGVACADCHEVHTQKTHSAENTDGLCAGCHQDQIQDVTHMMHGHIETGIRCIACHLARPGTDVPGDVKGQFATGHSFTVLVSTCDDCHPLPLQSDVGLP